MSAVVRLMPRRECEQEDELIICFVDQPGWSNKEIVRRIWPQLPFERCKDLISERRSEITYRVANRMP